MSEKSKSSFKVDEGVSKNKNSMEKNVTETKTTEKVVNNVGTSNDDEKKEKKKRGTPIFFRMIKGAIKKITTPTSDEDITKEISKHPYVQSLLLEIKRLTEENEKLKSSTKTPTKKIEGMSILKLKRRVTRLEDEIKLSRSEWNKEKKILINEYENKLKRLHTDRIKEKTVILSKRQLEKKSREELRKKLLQKEEQRNILNSKLQKEQESLRILDDMLKKTSEEKQQLSAKVNNEKSERLALNNKLKESQEEKRKYISKLQKEMEKQSTLEKELKNSIAQSNKFVSQLNKEKEEKNMLLKEKERSKMEIEMCAKRNQIIKEFFSTEKSYIYQLELLRNNFIIPISTKKLIKDSSKLFQNINTIYEINIQFFKELQEHVLFLSDNKRDEQLVLLILRFSGSFFLYESFVKRYKDLRNSIREYSLKSKKFTSFIEKTQRNLREKGERVYTFRGLLLTMCQRVPRYRLLLLDIKKKTLSYGGDLQIRKKLTLAIEKIDIINKYLSSKSKEFEEQRIVDNVSKKLNTDIFSKKLLYERDNIVRVRSKKKGKVNSNVWLFNNLMVVTKVLGGAGYSLTGDPNKLVDNNNIKEGSGKGGVGEKIMNYAKGAKSITKSLSVKNMFKIPIYSDGRTIVETLRDVKVDNVEGFGAVKVKSKGKKVMHFEFKNTEIGEMEAMLKALEGIIPKKHIKDGRMWLM